MFNVLAKRHYKHFYPKLVSKTNNLIQATYIRITLSTGLTLLDSRFIKLINK